MAATTRSFTLRDRVAAACEMITGLYEEIFGTPYTGGATGVGGTAPRGRGRPAGSTSSTSSASTANVAASGPSDNNIIEAIQNNPGVTRAQLLNRLALPPTAAGRFQLKLNNWVKAGVLSETGTGDNRTYTATGRPVPQTMPRRRAA